MKKAIANYINARAELVRSKIKVECKHKFELVSKADAWSKFNTDYQWLVYTYRCKKCGNVQKFDTRAEDNITFKY